MKPFGESGIFQSATETTGLGRQAVRGAGVTVFTSAVGFAVQLVSTAILARLLTPADFGVVTMVTTFSLMLASFGLNGFTEAVIQRDEVTDSLVSNLFWINLAAGIVLTIVFAGAGSLLARFYGDARVTRVAVGMSLTIFLSSLSVQHLALLKRAMLFSAVSRNDLVARVMSVIVSVLLGWAGWGYWALVAGAIGLQLSTSIGAWILCRWIPGRPRRVQETGSVVGFAAHICGRFGINYFARNLDNLLIGWRLGSGALGFYKKAYDLFVLPASQLLSPIAAVVIAALSRSKRDLVQFRRFFTAGIAILAFVGMGIGADLTLIGNDLIRFLLGPGWDTSGRIFTFFGPGIGVMLIYSTNVWIHMSIGRADRMFRWGLFEFVVTAISFVIALPYGSAAIAIAWTVSYWVLIIPAFWYAGKPIGFGISPVIAASWKYLVASLLAGGISAVVIRQMPLLLAASGTVGALVRICTTSLLFWTLYLGTVVLIHGGYEPLQQITKLMPDLIPWRKLSRSPSVVAASSS